MGEPVLLTPSYPGMQVNTYATLTGVAPGEGNSQPMIALRRVDGAEYLTPFFGDQTQLPALKELIGREVRVFSMVTARQGEERVVMQSVVWEPPYDPLHDNWQAIQAGSLQERIVRINAEYLL